MVDAAQVIGGVRTAICGAAIVANVMAVVVFAATKQLRIKYYGFVFNLVLADIAAPVCVLLYPTHLPVPVVPSLMRTSLCAAELSVLAIAVNRLLALTISPPARYDVTVTPCRVLAACLLTWVASAALYVPTTLISTPLVTRLVRPSIALVILLVTAVLYFAVFRLIARYTPPLASTEGVGLDDAVARTRLRQTRHLMITFTVILATSFACWIPYCIANYTVYVSGKNYAGLISSGFRNFYVATLTLLMLNSLLNPFIYWWRIPEFRGALCRLVRLGRGNAEPDNDVVTLETMSEPEN